MANWNYIIEKLSTIRPAKTVRLRDMKTDDEVWWEESIKVDVDDHYSRLIGEFACENAAQEKKIADLDNKIGFLNAEIDMLEYALECEQTYSSQIEQLVPKKKLKKFWKEQRKSG